jgi:hypothetical protein
MDHNIAITVVLDEAVPGDLWQVTMFVITKSKQFIAL